MSHFPALTPGGIGETHAMAYGEHPQTFDPERVVFTHITVPTDTFLGPPFGAQLNIPFQVDDDQHTQQTGSYASSAAGENKIRKSDLPPTDRDNVDHACDLLILEIIETIGWNPTAEQLATSGKECLSQACAENEHHTEWDDNIRRMFTEHMQLFRSKMASKAEKFAKRYELSNIVDPANSLKPTERRTAAMAMCEQMLADANWQIYYLHRYDAAAGTCALFANQIFHDYHLDFWYRCSISPFCGRRQNLNAWAATPLRLLSTSAAALACGLRRVAQCVGLTTKPATAVRYGLDKYTQVEAQILRGMQGTLYHEEGYIREEFEMLLSELHRRGCNLVGANTTTNPGFYIPTVQQLQGVAALTN